MSVVHRAEVESGASRLTLLVLRWGCCGGVKFTFFFVQFTDGVVDLLVGNRGGMSVGRSMGRGRVGSRRWRSFWA